MTVIITTMIMIMMIKITIMIIIGKMHILTYT